MINEYVKKSLAGAAFALVAIATPLPASATDTDNVLTGRGANVRDCSGPISQFVYPELGRVMFRYGTERQSFCMTQREIWDFVTTKQVCIALGDSGAERGGFSVGGCKDIYNADVNILRRDQALRLLNQHRESKGLTPVNIRIHP